MTRPLGEITIRSWHPSASRQLAAERNYFIVMTTAYSSCLHVLLPTVFAVHVEQSRLISVDLQF